MAISVFLTRRSQYVALGSVVAVLVGALLLTAAPRVIGERRLRALIKQGQRATAQNTLRRSIVLLMVLLVTAERFGLDVVLGAMLAGLCCAGGLAGWKWTSGPSRTSSMRSATACSSRCSSYPRA